MEQGNSALYHEISFSNRDEGFQAELPPGFRFHPTDEELISHYLSKKVMDSSFDPKAIGVVDLNKSEPWELPKRAKLGEKEWYFFCLRDRKYPTGLRTNRATDSGYWKATGKDKEIYRGKLLIGLKKTLVFYRGRAPRGEKSNWVMHEFRMEGKFPPHSFPGSTKNDWVICRVFKKSLVGNGKKAFGQPSPNLPPLMDIQSHVTCFSNAMEGPKAQDPELLRFFNPTFQPSPDISSLFFSKFGQNSASFYAGGFTSLLEGSKMAERDISQETGLTSDLNQEISSGNEIGRSNFEECVWNC